jgi:hypothetical protein
MLIILISISNIFKLCNQLVNDGCIDYNIYYMTAVYDLLVVIFSQTTIIANVI